MKKTNFICLYFLILIITLASCGSKTSVIGPPNYSECNVDNISDLICDAENPLIVSWTASCSAKDYLVKIIDPNTNEVLIEEYVTTSNYQILDSSIITGSYLAIISSRDTQDNLSEPLSTTCEIEPICTPSTEICDGIDNDCNGSVDEDNVCITKPLAPNDVTVTNGDGKLIVNWTSVADATSYKIYYDSTDDNTYDNKIENIATTSQEIAELTNNTTYYIVITALNSAGESEYSNKVSGMPQATATLPYCKDVLEAPTIYAVYDTNTLTPSIKWTKVNEATTYWLWIIAGFSGWISTNEVIDKSITLVNGTSYNVKIAAKSNNCQGSDSSKYNWSTVVNFIIDQSDDGCPKTAPSNLSIINTNTLQPTFSWDIVINTYQYGLQVFKVNDDGTETLTKINWWLHNLNYTYPDNDVFETGITYKARIISGKNPDNDSCVSIYGDKVEFTINIP
jgi:hypothetical protein